MNSVAEKAYLREIPDGFLEKMEDFCLERAIQNLRSLRRALEAQMGSVHDSRLSASLDGVMVALESIGGAL